MKKVSVMMPAFNAEAFIAQALDSILAQDYENLEVVVCDDASKDGTAGIILGYAQRYPGKVKAIVNEKNLGVTSNCNLSLYHCDGDFVSLFAGDDLMLPGKISKQVAALEAQPDAVLCYHPVEIFNSDTDECLFVTNQLPREDVNNFDDMLLKGGIPGGCSIMVRRTAIPEGGYDHRLKTVSDWLFFLEISLKGRVIKVPEVLGRYRKHLGGASMQTYKLLEESLLALDLLVEKYPMLVSKIDLINRAKARYLAGEAFRQLELRDNRAYTLTGKLLAFDTSLKYRILHITAWIALNVPFVSTAISFGAGKAKFLIKRLVG